MAARHNGSYRRLDLDPVKVGLVLDDITVTGTMHAQCDKTRFSDAWESLLREARSFMPITDAEVRSHDGGEPRSSAFMLVDKQDVRAVFPTNPDSIGRGTPHRFETVPTEAVLVLERMRISGTLHLPPDKGRFSDAWESLMSQPRESIAVTGAEMTSHDGQRIIATTDFVAVDKREILTAFPVEAEPENDVPWKRHLEPVAMAVVLEGFRVEGTVHVEQPKDHFARFSDNWDALMRDRRRFIPVTSAKVTSLDAGLTFAEAPFLVLDKQEIRAAFPLD